MCAALCAALLQARSPKSGVRRRKLPFVDGSGNLKQLRAEGAGGGAEAGECGGGACGVEGTWARWRS